MNEGLYITVIFYNIQYLVMVCSISSAVLDTTMSYCFRSLSKHLLSDALTLASHKGSTYVTYQQNNIMAIQL